jgi:hypothetical protein
MSIQNHWGACPFSVRNEAEEPFCIIVKGRTRWALETLIEAGDLGVTSYHKPAPRLAAYIFNLRQLGVDIETVNEPHEGPFSGTHARYILRSTVSRKPFGEECV